MKINKIIYKLKRVTIAKIVIRLKSTSFLIHKRLLFYVKNKVLNQWQFTYYCKGDHKKLHLGKNVSTVNTLFNTSSGHIYIDDNTIFGHNVMVLTGVHEFLNGVRKSLITKGLETPLEGFDIKIGKGCWIASGVIITGKVNIGDNVIIGAGAVVTKDIPSNVFAAGVPAKVLKKNVQ
jgi:galactoside O-acetyltransferase